MDTGSSDYYVNRSFAEKHSLVIQNSKSEVTIAETSERMPVFGQCFVNLYEKGNEYNNVAFLTFSTILAQMLSSERKFFKNIKR